MCILIFNFHGTSSKVFSNRADLEYEAKAIRITGRPEAQRLLVSWPFCGAFGQIQCLTDRRSSEDEAFFGREIDSVEVNWSLMRWWLRHCSQRHGSLCQDKNAGSARQRLHRNMRVIDTFTYRVVPYRPEWEYVALTYVWGEHLMGRKMPTMNKQRVHAYGSMDGTVPLPQWIPMTVRDAITAVQRLGYRYLWVDSLCIVQDDDSDRHSQLLRMDSIYRNASLAIAAASGDHANCGLSGMSIARKFQQQRETVSDVSLAVPLPRFDELNTGATLTWNTRAWTFQEKVLSRRLLIFTDYQVYFRCSNGVWSEDTAAETTRPARPDGKTLFAWGTHKLPHDFSTRRPYSLVDFLTFGSLKLAKTEAQGSFANYAAVAEEYTQRTLTFQRDALPAIDGVLKVLDPAPAAYVAGLPTRVFHEALLWSPKIGSTAKEMTGTAAPSWSWARWSLPDGCAWQRRDVKGTKGPPTDMIYWTIDELGPRPISPAPNPHNIPTSTSRVSRHLKESGTLLGWWARTAEFAVGKMITDHGIREAYDHESDDKVAVYELKLSRESPMIGEVITTIGVVRGSRHKSFEFVEMSRGAEFRFASSRIPKYIQPTTERKVFVEGTPIILDDGISIPTEGHYETKVTVDPPHSWSVVNLMMVERSPDGILYRRGIGKILVAEWAKLSTRREFVLLG